MGKRKVLQRNRIALFLAVMLMFCAFWPDGFKSGANLFSAGSKVSESTLASPGAGEFFTGFLPLREQQSVRELLADWQSIVILRPGRITEGKSGCREMQVSLVLPMSLRKTTFGREYPIAEGGAPVLRCRDVIVCYIHNQDGAKG